MLKHYIFKKQLSEFLTKLGFTDITEENPLALSFHNPDDDYSSTLMNQYAPQIIDFIDKNGFDSDDFIIRGSIIELPEDFEDK